MRYIFLLFLTGCGKVAGGGFSANTGNWVIDVFAVLFLITMTYVIKKFIDMKFNEWEESRFEKKMEKKK